MLSLEARRPSIIRKLRNDVTQDFANTLDNDAELLALLQEEDVSESPSLFAEKSLGFSLIDKSLSIIQSLTENPEVGGKLINSYWHVVHLRPYDGTFVLSDRPLIRINGFHQPGAAWILPLSPYAAFVAVNHKENLQRIKNVTPRRFANLTNVSSAHQADRFIFCTEKSHENWIGKYLDN